MKERVAGISALVNFVLAVGKIFVGLLAGATSVFAEGIHSAMDVLSSGIAFFGIKLSKKPVDEKHPYGHYKFEVLAGLIITFILFLTGLFIIFDAYREFQNPSPISVGYLALGIMVFSAIVNEVMARVKIHYGKKENSVSLISDGVHSRVDVYTSLAVLIGLLASNYWLYADSILAFLIGLYIIKESFSLGKEATDSLLDVSADKEDEDQIEKILKEHKVEFSDLKTQKKGSVITANLKIKLSKKLNVEDATKIVDHLRKDLIDEVERLEYVAIQIESHDAEVSFFEPKEFLAGFGGGFGWKKKARFKEEGVKEAKGAGPKGFCICEKCGYKIKHERGKPCSKIKCPKCQGEMARKDE